MIFFSLLTSSPAHMTSGLKSSGTTSSACLASELWATLWVRLQWSWGKVIRLARRRMVPPPSGSLRRRRPQPVRLTSLHMVKKKFDVSVS